MCVWLAPYTYSVGKKTEQGNTIFSCTEPLDREHLTFSTDVRGTDNSVTHVGEHKRITKNGVVRIEGRTGQHVGTVNLGRWRLLATEHEQQDLIKPTQAGSRSCRMSSVPAVP